MFTVLRTSKSAKNAAFHTLFALSSGFLANAVAADAKVTSTLEAVQVIQAEDGTVDYASAEEASPGAVIEYRLTYENVSDEPLDGFVISAKVPPQTIFTGEANGPSQDFLKEVRVAGIGWATPPVYREITDDTGAVQRVLVGEHEYEGIRWKLSGSFPAGKKVSASYQVKIRK